MKLKRIKTAGLTLVCMLVLSNTYRVATTGAPIGSTGAPGESDCARSGCHTGNHNVNTGGGTFRIDIDDLNEYYTPGKTYRITVSLAQQRTERFGFSLVALNEDGKSVGALVVNDDARMQVLKGSSIFEGRDYITYKPLGTNPYTTGKGEWSFEWKAPNGEGAVTFYASGVSANNDGTDVGDQVYTSKRMIIR